MNRPYVWLAASLALLGAAPEVAAQQGPANLRPTRDVAVTYKVEGGGQAPRAVPVAWSASSQKVRAEPSGIPGWLLVDLPRNQARMIIDAQGLAVNLPAGDLTPLLGGLPPGTRMTAAGSATVAGQKCDNWRVSRPDGEGTVCLTRDGVILRASGRHQGRTGQLEATEVRYGAQDPSRFVIPAGYRTVTLPPALLSGLLGGR